MNDIGFEFDAAALPPAVGPAEWASAAGLGGRLEAPEREPEAPFDVGARTWASTAAEPLRPWWAPGNAWGGWAA